MKELFKNSLYSFHLLDEDVFIIRFDWTDKSKEMTYEEFQAACSNYAGFAWQYQAKHLLVNTCNFHVKLPDEFPLWREEQLNPRYYSLGVEKFAYVTKPELIHYMNDIPAESGKFETRNFTSTDEAINWLKK